jgi:CO dehydrogenase maturation factor
MRAGKHRIIAVCGKGGVGKTFLTAAMTKLLADEGNLKVLAIDADPAFGLAPALGVSVKRTIDDIRNDLVDAILSKNSGDRYEMATMLDYKVFEAIEECSNFGVLAIGRPETEGCYCQVNDLLKDVISSLAKSFEVVLIDGEAGIEQINRRVMKRVDSLVLVSDTSAKGVNVASQINKLVVDKRAVECDRIGLVINRAKDKGEVEKIASAISIDLMGWIPEDDMVRKYDFNGIPVTALPDNLPSILAVQEILKSLEIGTI